MVRHIVIFLPLSTQAQSGFGLHFWFEMERFIWCHDEELFIFLYFDSNCLQGRLSVHQKSENPMSMSKFDPNVDISVCHDDMNTRPADMINTENHEDFVANSDDD